MFWRRRKSRDEDLDREIRSHLELEAEEQQENGLPPEDAHYAAKRALGNQTLVKEELREVWRWSAIERLWLDLVYALRMLRKNPGFSTVAVLSLALGIGANTAIFTLINTIILQPLPVRHSEQLFALSRSNRSNTVSGFSYLFYREVRNRKDLFSSVVLERTIAPGLSTRGNAQLVTGEAVSGNYFDALGILPYAGRLLHNSDETAAGADRVVVLSYRFWKSRFDGDRSIIGKTIRLNTTPMTVIGISSPSYKGLRAGVSPDICVPITMWPQMLGDPALLPTPKDWSGFIVGRLKPSIRPKRAESALTALYRSFLGTFPHKTQPENIWLSPAATGLDSHARRASEQLYILMAVVGLVLLAACVNLANLLLARTGKRIQVGGPGSKRPWLTIVGVVGNEKDQDYFHQMGWQQIPEVFRPLSQDPPFTASLVLRTPKDETGLGAAIQKEVAAMDASVPVGGVVSMDQQLSKRLSYPRFRAIVLGGFAGLALLLAAVGLYGVLSQSIAQRTQEFGIRMALGAQKSDVLKLVIRQGMLLTAVGITAGLAVALALTRFLTSMLFGIKPTDPWTLAGVSLLLILVALLATYTPARRAAKVDPMTALRYE